MCNADLEVFSVCFTEVKAPTKKPKLFLGSITTNWNCRLFSPIVYSGTLFEIMQAQSATTRESKQKSTLNEIFAAMKQKNSTKNRDTLFRSFSFFRKSTLTNFFGSMSRKKISCKNDTLCWIFRYQKLSETKVSLRSFSELWDKKMDMVFSIFCARQIGSTDFELFSPR